jgi:hypothetical protein
MLTKVKIENYRGFKSYRIEGLTTVNLLVGKNNCGKTALLEGIHFLASGGDPMVLVDSAKRRGEVVFAGREEPLFADFSHFFHGHEVRAGSRFSLTGDSELSRVTVEAIPAGDAEPQQALFEESRSARPALALKIEGPRGDAMGGRPLFLSEDGALLLDPRYSMRRFRGEEGREGPPIVFIAPDSVPSASLPGMWNEVLRDKQEGEVEKALQILEPRLEDVVFQTGELVSRFSAGRSLVLASFAGDPRRVPLGSMGDGMRRLLALSISLIHAKGGYLLIDEIDTGLHYSIMAKMWELVVRTAKDSNIQVFATTHSADCVRGLGVLCKTFPELQAAVSAHKIVSDLEQSVTLTGSEVVNALEHEIEIR